MRKVNGCSGVAALTLSFWAVACMRPAFCQQASFAEAKMQIDQFWNKKIARCGGLSYIHYLGNEWKAMKNVRWQINQTPLGQAELLNGQQWQGSTMLLADVSRKWFAGQGWEEWEQGLGFGDFTVEVTKQNGRWKLTPSRYSAIPNMMLPTCSDVPPEPRARTEQEVAAGKSQAAASECARYFSTYLNHGQIDYFMEHGLDPKTCRGSMHVGPGPNDRAAVVTPLMAVAFGCLSDSVQVVLDAGVDVNATDANGLTALDYALKKNAINSSYGCQQTIERLRAAGARRGNASNNGKRAQAELNAPAAELASSSAETVNAVIDPNATAEAMLKELPSPESVAQLVRQFLAGLKAKGELTGKAEPLIPSGVVPVQFNTAGSPSITAVKAIFAIKDGHYLCSANLMRGAWRPVNKRERPATLLVITALVTRQPGQPWLVSSIDGNASSCSPFWELGIAVPQ